MTDQFLVNLTSAQIGGVIRKQCDKLKTGLSTENVDNTQASFKISGFQQNFSGLFVIN